MLNKDVYSHLFCGLSFHMVPHIVHFRFSRNCTGLHEVKKLSPVMLWPLTSQDHIQLSCLNFFRLLSRCFSGVDFRLCHWKGFSCNYILQSLEETYCVDVAVCLKTCALYASSDCSFLDSSLVWSSYPEPDSSASISSSNLLKPPTSWHGRCQHGI